MTDIFFVYSSCFAGLYLIKPGELYILELHQPEAWLLALTDGMLTFEQDMKMEKKCYLLQMAGVNIFISSVFVDSSNMQLELFVHESVEKLKVHQMFTGGSTVYIITISSVHSVKMIALK